MFLRVGRYGRLSTEELMLSNCGVGEDSWESLGLQGDPTSQSWRKSTLNIHWKDWCWSWSSSTLANWGKSQLIEKCLDAGKDWRQEERGQRMRWLNSMDMSLHKVWEVRKGKPDNLQSMGFAKSHTQCIKAILLQQCGRET